MAHRAGLSCETVPWMQMSLANAIYTTKAFLIALSERSCTRCRGLYTSWCKWEAWRLACVHSRRGRRTPRNCIGEGIWCLFWTCTRCGNGAPRERGSPVIEALQKEWIEHVNDYVLHLHAIDSERAKGASPVFGNIALPTIIIETRRSTWFISVLQFWCSIKETLEITA